MRDRRIEDTRDLNKEKVDLVNVVFFVLFFGSLASLDTINKLFFKSSPYPKLILIGIEGLAILLTFVSLIRINEWYKKVWRNTCSDRVTGRSRGLRQG